MKKTSNKFSKRHIPLAVLAGAISYSSLVPSEAADGANEIELDILSIEVFSSKIKETMKGAEEEAYHRKHEKIAEGCGRERFIAFAADGFDSARLFSSAGHYNLPLELLQDFDHLEASKVNACKGTLDELLKEGKLELFVRHGGSDPQGREFPSFSFVKDDDKDPNPKLAGYWAHEATHTNMPASKGLKGKGIRIGVMDTGVDPKVSQFKDQIKSFHDFVYNKKEAYDDSNHGTFVIGIINKVVPDASILVYKIHDKEGLNHMTDVLEGFNQVIADKIDVLNNSWGLSEPRELEGMTWEDGNKVLAEALERVAKSGVLIEASAGNDSYYTHKMDPAQLPNGSPYVISTGATSINGEISSFSDLDAHIFAPGALVYSTKNANEHRLWSGTSFSGPFVTAAIAVTHEYGGKHGYKFSRDDVLGILQRSAKQESSIIVLQDGREEKFSFKALDYGKLVEYLEKNYK